jgi:alpha-tubulin suppressor-like RCC1 family protein
LALLNDGQVMAWGINRFGQLGDGTSSGPDTCDGYPCSTTPVPVELNLSSGLTVTAIAAGSGHSLALLSNGRVMAWGENDSGQLGDGTFVGPNLCTQPGPSGYQNPCSTTPVAVRNLQGVTAIAAGTDHSLALLNNGSTVMAWGDNDVGALGDGTLINRSTPVAVQLNLPSGVKVTAISAAGGHSLALLSNGTVMAWGGTDLGDLGDGTLTGNACGNCQDLPVAVSSLTGVTQIAAGAWHGFAI